MWLSQLHGMFAAKLSVALMLVGGVTRISPDGMHIRGDIHVLMVGDPGTGVYPRLTISPHRDSGSGRCRGRNLPLLLACVTLPVPHTEQVGLLHLDSSSGRAKVALIWVWVSRRQVAADEVCGAAEPAQRADQWHRQHCGGADRHRRPGRQGLVPAGALLPRWACHRDFLELELLPCF